MNLLNLAVKIGIDDQVTGKIGSIASGITSSLGSAAAATGRAMAAATGAAVAGAAALGKTALDSYASYEQLSGGVEKLFGDAAGTVETYAQQAYKTMGLSANDYMTQATSFSAALINDLGGNTEAAAESANKAMTSMADNVSIFGSNVEDVQNAYQGFAKQNYAMLDNLKLGYGGSRSEMERLIADANEYAASIGEASDLSIDSFADVVDAIELIQRKQGIAGNAAKEASKTIEGSINATKAAWQNLLTEFAKDDGDVGARIQELMDSVMKVLFGEDGVGGIVPRIQTIVTNVTEAIPQYLPQIIGAVNQIIPPIVGAIVEMAPALLEGILGLITALSEALPDVLVGILPAIISLTPKLVLAGIKLFLGLVQALTEAGPQIMDAMSQAMTDTIEIIRDRAPDLLMAAGQFVLMILTAIVEHGPEIIGGLVSLISDLIGYILTHIPDILMAAGQFILTIATAILQNAPQILSDLGNVLLQLITSVVEKGPELLTAAGEFIGNIATAIGTAALDIFNAIGDAIQGAIDHVGDYVGSIKDAALNFMQGFVDGIVEAASTLANSVGDAVGGAVDTVKDFLGIASPSKLMDEMGTYTMEGFAQGIDGMAASANATMHETADYVMSAMSQVLGVSQDQFRQLMDVAMQGMINTVQMAYGPLLDMGNYIISGLVSGIQSNLGAVTDTLFGGVWNAVESVKAFLGIASPSKLFAQMGGFTMEGFEQGILGMADSAEKTMRDTFGSIYAAANGTVDTGQKYGSLGGGAPQVNIYIDRFVNNTAEDVRTLSTRLGELTSMEMKARGLAW